MKLRITILKYHSWYLCQISLEVMLLFVYTTTRRRFVIFTCRYFKLSWNTTALSQSNCRNFSCSSIKIDIQLQRKMNRKNMKLLLTGQKCEADKGGTKTDLPFSFHSLWTLRWTRFVLLQTNKFQGLFKDILKTNYSFQELRFIQ